MTPSNLSGAARELKADDWRRCGADAWRDFPRLERLRADLLATQKAICIERPRLLTEFFRREGFDVERPILRQARALHHVLSNLTPRVFDDELIVGSTTGKRLGTPIYPEFLSQSLFPELATIARRGFDPVSISDEEADYLAEEVFPFWKDRTIMECVRREGDDPEFLRIMERVIFFTLPKANGITHIIPDYAAVVGRGLRSLVVESAAQEARAEDEEARELHQAMRLSLEGACRLAARYADTCESQASSAAPDRAAELREIAAILRRVPAGPAHTLHEAIQSIWITQVALHQENSNMALSFGRLDQILDPLYQDDLAAGRMDPTRAVELLGCFFIKMQDHLPVAPALLHEILGGASTDQAVTVGGVRPGGDDGVNDMTYLLLRTSTLLRLREPNVCARLHDGAPPEYLHALVESIYENGAAPALYGDEPIIRALTANGVTVEDARDYGLIGCVEPTSCGRTMGMTGAIMFNLAAVLELALHDGVHPRSGLRIGPRTGRLEDLRTHEAFLEAFSRQLQGLVDLAAEGNARFAEVHARMHPTPLLSSLVQGCGERGRDVTRGGAIYNSSGVGLIGLADVADSLSAMKAVVFEQRRITPADLAAALRDDFEGHEKVRALLSRYGPKYGVDDPAADETAELVVRLVADAFERHRNPRGGRYHVGAWSLTLHTSLGRLTDALPSGRRRGAPLASGATPVSGAARSGPTAAFASTRRLSPERLANGIANNHKLQRGLLGSPGKLDIFRRLVQGYFAGGGMQVQFTVQDRETLLAAQRDPDGHRDLLVRVSGYTAYFCDLHRSMQDEIIARTEDRI